MDEYDSTTTRNKEFDVFDNYIKNAKNAYDIKNYLSARDDFIAARNILDVYKDKNWDDVKLNYATVCNNLAKSYLGLQEYQSAAEEFEKAGKIYLESGEIDEAVFAFEQAKEMHQRLDSSTQQIESLLQSALKKFEYHYKTKITTENKEKIDLIIDSDNKKVHYTKKCKSEYFRTINADIHHLTPNKLITAAAITLQGINYYATDERKNDKKVDAKENTTVLHQTVILHNEKRNQDKANAFCEIIADLLWIEAYQGKNNAQEELKKDKYKFVKKAVLQKMQDKHKQYKLACNQCMFELKKKYYQFMIKHVSHDYRGKLDAMTDDESYCNNASLHINESDLNRIGIILSEDERKLIIKFADVFSEEKKDEIKQSSNKKIFFIPKKANEEIIEFNESNKDKDEIHDILNKLLNISTLTTLLDIDDKSYNSNYEDSIDDKLMNYYTKSISHFTQAYYSPAYDCLRHHRNAILEFFNTLIENLSKSFFASNSISGNPSQDPLRGSEEESPLTEGDSSSQTENKRRSTFFRTNSQKILDTVIGIDADKLERTYANDP